MLGVEEEVDLVSPPLQRSGATDVIERESVREKSKYRRQVNKEHNSNLNAGCVSIQEEQLSKSGLRGRKKCFLWTCLTFLCVLAVCNLTVTFVLVLTLKLTPSRGFAPIEFKPSFYSQPNSIPENLISFLLPTSFKRLILQPRPANDFSRQSSDPSRLQPKILSFKHENLQVENDGDLQLQLKRHPSQTSDGDQACRPSLSIKTGSWQGVELTSNSFRLRSSSSPSTNQESPLPVLSEDQGHGSLRLPSSISSASVDHMIVARLSSPLNGSLLLTADKGNVSIQSNEGIRFESRSMQLKARSKDINIQVKRKTLTPLSPGGILSLNHSGIFLNLRRIPVVSSSSSSSSSSCFYKLCVCRFNRRLFRVPIRKLSDGCRRLSHVNNPCRQSTMSTMSTMSTINQSECLNVDSLND